MIRLAFGISTDFTHFYVSPNCSSILAYYVTVLIIIAIAAIDVKASGGRY